jgi:hypothetical protein
VQIFLREFTFFAQKELIKRLNDIEWVDFECKETLDKLPDNIRETVLEF